MTATLPAGQNLPGRRPCAAVGEVRQPGHGTQQLAEQAARLGQLFWRVMRIVVLNDPFAMKSAFRAIVEGGLSV